MSIFYVSVNGNDENPGTVSQPFRSIQKAADIMYAGDTCVVREGLYSESVRPVNSGQSGKPIVFKSFEGENVVIKGTEQIKDWNIHEVNIFKANVDFKTRQVFINDQPMISSCYPNTGLEPFKRELMDIEVHKEYFTGDFGMKPENYWKGCILWCTCIYGWVYHSVRVIASSGNKLFIDNISKPEIWDGYDGKDQTPYAVKGYIKGGLNLLDAEYEWCQDSMNNLYICLPEGTDPNRESIEVKKRDFAFNLSERSYIELHNLLVVAASADLTEAHYCKINRSRFKYVAVHEEEIKTGWVRDKGVNGNSVGMGIRISGSHNEVSNCYVEYSEGDGITVYGNNNCVFNCIVHDCSQMGTDCAPITTTGQGHVFECNTIYNSGRSILVHRYLAQGKIILNNMYNAGLITGDLGITYTFKTDGEGTEIAYNWVHDNHAGGYGGAGIYLDNHCSNHIVHHNVIWNIHIGRLSSAFGFNYPNCRETIFNNTLYNVSCDISEPGDWDGSKFFNNIFTRPLLLGQGAEAHNNYELDNPCFMDAAADNFQLRKDSPCIDAGAEFPPYTDGFIGKAPDIGAYEYSAEPFKPGSTLDEKCK